MSDEAAFDRAARMVEELLASVHEAIVSPIRSKERAKEDLEAFRRLRAERDAAIGHVRHLVNHWHEFGPEHGFDESMDGAYRWLQRIGSEQSPADAFVCPYCDEPVQVSGGVEA